MKITLIINVAKRETKKIKNSYLENVFCTHEVQYVFWSKNLKVVWIFLCVSFCNYLCLKRLHFLHLIFLLRIISYYATLKHNFQLRSHQWSTLTSGCTDMFKIKGSQYRSSHQWSTRPIHSRVRVKWFSLEF